MWKDSGSLTNLTTVNDYFKLRTANADNVANEPRPVRVTLNSSKLSSKEKKLIFAVVFLSALCLALLIVSTVLATRQKFAQKSEQETIKSFCNTQDCLFAAVGK